MNPGARAIPGTILGRAIVASAIALLAFLSLPWLHSSWDTDLPVLGFLSPVVSAASALGEALSPLFRQPPAISLLSFAALAALLPDWSGRARLLPAFLAASMLVLGQHWLAAESFAAYYGLLLVGLCLALVWQLLLAPRDGAHGVAPASGGWWCAAILLLAFVFRFYGLDTNPPGINDEMAHLALDLRNYVNGRESALADFVLGQKPLSWLGNVAGLFSVFYLKALGFTPLALRLLSATTGVLSVGALFLLGRRLFGTRVALLASFLLATSPWHAFFTRSNYPHYGLPTLHGILSFHLLLIALEKRRLAYFGLLGALLGLAVYLYEPGKFILVSVGACGLIAFVRDGIRDRSRRNLLALAGCAALLAGTASLTVVPHLRAGLYDRTYFLSHAGPDILRKKKGYWERGYTFSENVVLNARKIVPVLTHDRRTPRHAGPVGNKYSSRDKGVLHPVVVWLVVVGLACSLRCVRREPFQLLLIWSLTALAPALFTAVLPKRLIPMIAPLYLLAGVGADALLPAGLTAGLGRFRHAALRLVAIAVASLVISVQLWEVLGATDFPAFFHPAYQTHRRAIDDAARTTELHTDIRSSIVRFLFANAPYHETGQLTESLPEMLGAAEAAGKGLTILAAARKPENRKLAAWIGANTGRGGLETVDFILIGVPAEEVPRLRTLLGAIQ